MELSVLQVLVRRWCVRAFGQEIADNHRERNHRFLEEALELCQSLGCSQEDAHVLVDYVYGRPTGQPGQKVGGVMITLAALCGAHEHLSMDVEAKLELARINSSEVLEKIRAKQAAKQRDIPLSPLPGRPALNDIPGMHRWLANRQDDEFVNPQASPDMFCTGCQQTRRTYRATEGDSAGVGSICCGHCQRVLLTPKPLSSPPGQGQPRTHIDAVGTTGGKATVSHLQQGTEQRGGTNPLPRTVKPDFNPPGQQ